MAAEPTRPSGRRDTRRAEITARILEIGRVHLAEHGAAALSLRSVTRDLGMVSSAVYRYVAGRDDLLTLLLVDAYDELADAVQAAVDAVAEHRWDRRARAATTAFRRWALGEPARYALLYGSPVPGYAAPAQQTVEPGTRVIRLLLDLIAEGVAAGAITDPVGPVPLPPVLRTDLAATLADFGPDLEPGVIARALLLWSTLIGATSLEVFGQYGPDGFGHPDAVFDQQIDYVLDLFTRA